jgi:hypothetical protein
MSNSESLDNIVNKKNNTNIITHNMGSNDVINALNVKALIGLFVIFILITNNIFTENILSKIKGTYNGTRLTVVGIIVQSIIMIILYIALLFLIKYEIV